MTATFHLRFPSAKTSSYMVPLVIAAGSAFGMQSIFLLLAVVTRWAGQLKAQVYHQVAMHRVGGLWKWGQPKSALQG